MLVWLATLFALTMSGAKADQLFLPCINDDGSLNANTNGASPVSCNNLQNPAGVPTPGSTSTASSNCRIGLRYCHEIITPPSPVPNVAPSPDMIANIKKNVDTKINYYYQGYDVSLNPVPNPNGSPTPTPQFPLPICNLEEGELTQSNQTLHQGPVASCGDWMTFSSGHITADNGKGTREAAYMRGAFMQDIRCYETQVLDEVKNGKKFDVTHIQSAALDANTSAKILGIDGCRLQYLCDTPETGGMRLGSTDYCDPGNMAGISADNAKHRIAACHLAAARASLETVFATMAYVEIIERAHESWVKNYVGTNSNFSCPPPGRYPGIQWEMKCGLADPCQSWARANSSAPVCVSLPFGVRLCAPINVPNQSKFYDLLGKCYQGTTGDSSAPKGYTDQLKTLIEKYFPSNGNCAPISSLGGFFPLIGTLGFKKRRRRRRKSNLLSNERGLMVLLAGAVAGISGMIWIIKNVVCIIPLLNGISWCQNSNPSVDTYCITAAGIPINSSAVAQLCCAGPGLTVPITPMPANCPYKALGGNDTPDNVSRVLGDLDLANNNIQTAAIALNNGATSMSGSKIAAQSAAATAAGSGSQAPANPGPGAGATSLATGGGSVSGGGSSGGSSGFSSSDTSSSASSNVNSVATSKAQSGFQSGTQSGYSTVGANGSNSGRAKNTVKSFFNDFLAGFPTEGPVGSNGIQVADLSPERRKLAGAATPLAPGDYFLRIEKSDSLFKHVEKKYHEKAQGWARQDALYAPNRVKHDLLAP